MYHRNYLVVAVSYSKEEWIVWPAHFFKSVASEQLVKMDRTPMVFSSPLQVLALCSFSQTSISRLS